MFEGDGTLLQKLPEDGPSSVTCTASQQHVSNKSSLIFRKHNFLLIAGVSNKVSKMQLHKPSVRMVNLAYIVL